MQSRPRRVSHKQPGSFGHCDPEKTTGELQGTTSKLDWEVRPSRISRALSAGPACSAPPRATAHGWVQTWEVWEQGRGEEGRLRAGGRDGIAGALERRAAPSGRPASPPGPPSSLTSVLSWVVNVEVPVPHDCQLHRQVVDLHPFIGILPPGRG